MSRIIGQIRADLAGKTRESLVERPGGPLRKTRRAFEKDPEGL
jgi:hypothetical protein